MLKYRMIFWYVLLYILGFRLYLFENSKYILFLLNFPNGGIFMLENLFRILFLTQHQLWHERKAFAIIRHTENL